MPLPDPHASATWVISVRALLPGTETDEAARAKPLAPVMARVQETLGQDGERRVREQYGNLRKVRQAVVEMTAALRLEPE